MARCPFAVDRFPAGREAARTVVERESHKVALDADSSAVTNLTGCPTIACQGDLRDADRGNGPHNDAFKEACGLSSHDFASLSPASPSSPALHSPKRPAQRLMRSRLA